MYSTRVLVLLALLVGFAHCFSWDIVVGGDKQLEFYNNGTLTHTEKIQSANQITSVTYDPVHYRVLFTDINYRNTSISSFDLSTREIQTLYMKSTFDNYVRVVYDPVTQLLVWRLWYHIFTFSLNPASSNKSAERKLLVYLSHICRDVAVDSCGGYIYWITDFEIERVRLDGSDREVIVASNATQLSLAIDQQTQRLYWIDYNYISKNGSCQMSIKSANFIGRNQTTIYTRIAKTKCLASSLAVSKDFIYWQYQDEKGTWQLPKNSSEHVARKLQTTDYLSSTHLQRVAANYTIQEQIQGIKCCEALQDLIPNNSKPECTVSICQNYCLEGDCSVNAGGQPTCSCETGYTGQRCEVNACYQYCLHSGVCTLNEEDEPFCECTADYEGERCDVAITHAGDFADNSTQQVLREVRDLRSGVRQGFKEELKHILHLFSDKLDEEDEAKKYN